MRVPTASQESDTPDPHFTPDTSHVTPDASDVRRTPTPTPPVGPWTVSVSPLKDRRTFRVESLTVKNVRTDSESLPSS